MLTIAITLSHRLIVQLMTKLEEARVHNEKLDEQNKLLEKAREASSACASHAIRRPILTSRA
jgi:hypothetical protein